jgi:hypothetical protein
MTFGHATSATPNVILYICTHTAKIADQYIRTAFRSAGWNRAGMGVVAKGHAARAFPHSRSSDPHVRCLLGGIGRYER